MDQAVATRNQPNSLEAEQSVVGAMMSRIQVIDDVVAIITKEDFYFAEYGFIFEAIAQLNEEHIRPDFTTITERLRRNSAPPMVCDSKFLSDLATTVPLYKNAAEYAKIVKDKATLRRIISKSQEIIELCYNDSEAAAEVLDRAEQGFMALLQSKGEDETVPIHVIVKKAMDRIRQAYANKGSLTGIPTGFKDLDDITSGLQRSDLILVAARPSMGKTAFALNIAAHVAFKQDLPVLVYSLEMSRESIMRRFFAIEGGIDAQRLSKGELEDEDWTNLVQTADEISKSKLIIDGTPGLTMAEIRSKSRKYKQKNDVKLIIIDYLQLISSTGKTESKQQEISAISQSLKALARELDVPVIALSQLNRGAEQREDKRPMLSDLRDSGAIEQDADIVMLLYRDEYYNKDSKEKGVSEVIIAKHRNGPTGTVNLAWLAQYTRFANRNKPKNTMDVD